MRIIQWGSLCVAALVLTACVETETYYSEPSPYRGGYQSEMAQPDAGYRSSQSSHSAPAATGGYGSSAMPMQQSMTGTVPATSSGYVSSH